MGSGAGRRGTGGCPVSDLTATQRARLCQLNEAGILATRPVDYDLAGFGYVERHWNGIGYGHRVTTITDTGREAITKETA